MNAKAFGRDFAMSFRRLGGGGAGVPVFLSLPSLFVDEFRVCSIEVLDFSLRLTDKQQIVCLGD